MVLKQDTEYSVYVRMAIFHCLICIIDGTNQPQLFGYFICVTQLLI